VTGGSLGADADKKPGEASTGRVRCCTVAIHQPNFFPWLGYFDKIRRCDVFVFLDDVAYPKSGSGMGSIVNRTRININGQARWIGCPLTREPGQQRIRAVRIDNKRDWRRKVLRSLEVSYRRFPNFRSTFAAVKELIECDAAMLADFNIQVIQRLSSLFGYTPRFVRQSELPVDGRSTELLIALTRAVGGDTYLCGGGAAGYQDDALFAAHGIDLVYQRFMPPRYGDPRQFIPGLSVIDFMMCEPDWQQSNRVAPPSDGRVGPGDTSSIAD
jgi:hypothetical protein